MIAPSERFHVFQQVSPFLLAQGSGAVFVPRIAVALDQIACGIACAQHKPGRIHIGVGDIADFDGIVVARANLKARGALIRRQQQLVKRGDRPIVQIGRRGPDAVERPRLIAQEWLVFGTQTLAAVVFLVSRNLENIGLPAGGTGSYYGVLPMSEYRNQFLADVLTEARAPC